MPNYRYKARDPSGAVITGTYESSGAEGVSGYLGRLGLTPVSILEEKPKDTFSRTLEGFSKIRQEEIVIFSQQFVTLTGAGLPFLSVFAALEQQTSNPKLKMIVAAIRRDVERGKMVSEAMARHPEAFGSIYISMVRAGETSGMLDVMLDRLVMILEHDMNTRSKIKAAIRYPMIVFIALVIAFFIVVLFVIPRFATLYEGFQVELPLPTRILIWINHVAHHYGLLILIGAGLSGVGVVKLINTPDGRLWWDGVKLRLPIFGAIFMKTALSRFARVFGILMRAGLPLPQTLDIVADTVGNKAISGSLLSLKGAVQQGEGMSRSIRSNKLFTPLVVEMIAVGEETGNMETMMLKVSEYYDRDVEYAIKNMTASLEPIFLVVIGGAILLLALAIFLPWWNLINVAKGGG